MGTLENYSLISLIPPVLRVKKSPTLGTLKPQRSPVRVSSDVVYSLNFQVLQIETLTTRTLGMENDNKTWDHLQELATNCPRTQQQENFSVTFLLQIINGTSDPIFVKDRHHCWVLVNDGFCNFIGRNREELIGKSDYDFFPKAEADVLWEKDEIVFSTGITDENEECFTDAQGITHLISTKKCLFEDITGNKFLVGTIRDITENITKYKQVEAELGQSQQLPQLVIDNIPPTIFSQDPHSVYLGCNQKFSQLLGVQVHNRIICQWYKSPLVGDNSERIGLVSKMLDLTEDQQTEKSLLLYKQAVESSSDAIAITDAAGNHIYQNPAFGKLYECETVKEFIKFGGLPIAITDPVIAKEIWQTTVAGQSWIGEVEQQSAGGRIMQTFLRAYPLKDAAGNHIGLVGTITDITERKRSEELLRQQEQFLRTVYDGSEHLIFVVDIIDDSEFCYTGWNPATERATGLSRSKVIGKSPADVYGAVYGAAAHRNYLKCLQAGTAITYEECLSFHNEETWWLTTLNPLKDSEGRIYRLVGTTLNISKRKLVEIQLQQQTKKLETAVQELQQAQMHVVQSEKMSGLGQLVAGVAHEINNPVNFIYGNLIHANDYTQDLLALVQLYQQHYSQPIPEIQELATEIDLEFLMQDLPQLLNSMRVGAQRIREIVISLRTFSRMDDAEMKQVDIHEGIDSTLMILEHRFKAKPNSKAIKVIKQYRNLPLVQCYAGQLNQVFMNILANAIDALEDSSLSSGSTVVNPDTTDDTQKTPEQPQILIYTQLVEPNKVEICIADNGPGISQEVKQRLFDPFFTTKPIGKGTGMGLSISYQIISQKHGGSLECFSQPGQGTEFVITIPLRQDLS
ncbi:MAG: PAS domain-containing sensor histidine kinase [Gloeotrichia echinulata DVL01]|nr:PAS domain-containing protein [Gloeotrichia echinulata DEX184]